MLHAVPSPTDPRPRPAGSEHHPAGTGTGTGTGTGLADAAPNAPTHLIVAPWWDPDLARSGFDPRSEYAERYWLGIAGPSTLLLLRRLARGLAEHPAGIRIDLAETARALGLGAGRGRNAPIMRTVERACMFGLARRPSVDRLEVRTHLPRLNARQLQRLPEVLQRTHDAWSGEHHPPSSTGPHGPRAA
jgi:hypothetical protein